MAGVRRYAEVEKKKAFIAAGFFFAALFLLRLPSADAALGISPPFINATHLVPGAVYTQTIYLVQDQPNDDLPMKTNFDISDKVRPWISLDTGTNFVIPKGTRQFPVTVTITVPKDEPLGDYSGNMSFASDPGKNGQVTIALGVNVALNFTVGTGIYESYQAYVSFLDIEEGWSPRVDVKFRNDGNIPESFDAATFELYDQFDAVRLAYIQKNSGFEETPAFATREYTVEFPTDFHIGIGEYWGIANFFKNGQLVAWQKTVFQVVPPGSLSNSKNSGLAFIGNSVQKYWQYYGGGAVIVAIGYLLYRKKKLPFLNRA